MKRIALVVLCVLTASIGAWAQGGGRAAPPPPPPLEPGASQADVDKALLGAPASCAAQATVIKWKTADWTYDTLRKGHQPAGLLRQVGTARTAGVFARVHDARAICRAPRRT